MNKKTLFVVLLAMLCLAVFTVSVSADQDGLENWCNIDQYGCWVTGDEGEQNYIMFWSEETRQYFMGDKTAPYKNVVDRCVDCTEGKLPLSKSWVRPITQSSFGRWVENCRAEGGEIVFVRTDERGANWFRCDFGE
ncbi:MAG: hypothetical protein IJI14_02095 [Anaerolineaceae bacterium]|nr:hypothetical protein [Anaerolineaceae bacterium]